MIVHSSAGWTEWYHAGKCTLERPVPTSMYLSRSLGTVIANFHAQMLLWTQTNPQRDCTFEKDVIVHEYTHGRKLPPTPQIW